MTVNPEEESTALSHWLLSQVFWEQTWLPCWAPLPLRACVWGEEGWLVQAGLGSCIPGFWRNKKTKSKLLVSLLVARRVWSTVPSLTLSCTLLIQHITFGLSRKHCCWESAFGLVVCPRPGSTLVCRALSTIQSHLPPHNLSPLVWRALIFHLTSQIFFLHIHLRISLFATRMPIFFSFLSSAAENSYKFSPLLRVFRRK